MSNKDILEYLVKELLVERDVSQQLSNFEQLYPLITACEIHTYETEFSHIVKLHLNSGNLDLQKCALTLLNICLTELQIVIKEHLYIDTAYQIVEIAFSGTVDSIENQELWLKAFTAISLLEDVFKELCKHRTVQIISILTTSLSSLTNSVQKVKALQMFNKLLLNIDADNVSDEIFLMLISVWRQPIFPMAFQDVAVTIQKAALICANSLLPYVHKYLRTSNQVWKEIGAPIQEEYIPLMSNLIEEKNDLYGDLWIYLIKLIGDKINTGVPILNSLLSVIENAFKSVSFDIRITAFNCWKVLIESMFLNPNADYTSRRIKLLIIPLKTNNSKTEELTRVKFETWFTLFNVLKTKNACSAVGTVDIFLSFCFGPLDAPLKSYIHPANISPGKKYFRFHLTCCRALLQIMGNRKYITDELNAKLKKFSITGPILTLDGFVEISEIVVNSVGECSVMLSQLQVQDDCVQMNQAVWKSLFNFVDSMQDEENQTKIIKQVAAMIIAIVSLARKKPNLIHFSILPLFDNIISNEFKFFNEDIMFELIFLPMLSSVLKKDKALLRPEIIPLFEKIFLFKRHSPNFITFLDSFMKRITVVPREELPMDKLEVLQSLWFLVEPELVVLLANARGQTVDESLFVSLYKEYLYWPAASFYRFSREAIVSKWKNMYNLFGQCLTSVIQIKLAFVLLKDLYTFIQKNPNVLILAELVHYVIQNLRVEDCTEDNCADVYDVYNGLKNIVLLSDLSADTLDIYQSCLAHVLVTSSTLPYLHRVIQPITDCLDSILNQHKKTGVLAAVHKFFTTLKYTDNLESHIVSMVDNLKSLPTLTVELTRLVTTAESVTKIKFDFEKSKESSSSEQSSKKPNNADNKKEKEQRISLLGHDVDTMTPIKVKGSMLKNDTTPSKPPKSQLPVAQKLTKDDDNFVVVDTPYKFDPKKLTKKQKSKLSRRRDDIPALYQDLSQSQSHSLCSNSESFSDLPVISENNQDEAAVKLTENVDSDLNGIRKTEEISESARPFAELSKTYSESSVKENTQMSLLENNTPTTNVRKSVSVKRARRKSTGTRKKDAQERNGTVLDYAGIIFTDNEEQRSSSVQESLPNREFASDNETVRRRVQKELQRIKIDVNDGEEYKNKSTKRRTRSDYIVPEELFDNRKKTRSRRCTELNTKVDLNNGASAKVNDKSERKTFKIKVLMKPPEVSIEKEIRDSSKLQEPIQMETDSEPVIESSQNRELNCKPFKIPALHQFQKIKPGEHIVIKDCQSTVDLVVKGPKETSPFKVINKSGVTPTSGRILFPESNDSETPDLIEQPEITVTDTGNSDKQKNSVTDQMAMECDSNSSVPAEESDNGNNTDCMSHLYIQTDSTNVSLDTTNCEEISAANANKDTVQVNQNDTTVSINSQLLAELDVPNNNTVVEKPGNDEVCRKVVFNTSASSDESGDKDKLNKNSEFDSPPHNVQSNNIVTSPICSDTPTRNSDLIRNTVDISPIKDVPNHDSDATFIHVESVNNSVIAGTPTRSEQDNEDETKKNETSPLLFSNDTVGEINESDSKKDLNETPNSRIIRKNKSKYLSTRGAQMMNMVSANTPSGTNGAKKQKISSRFSDNKQFFSPRQSRIAKMMGQFQKTDDQETGTEDVTQSKISEQDIFSFSKELPRPTDSPSCSILRKRKVPDFVDDGMSPASKRKRVNFSDPEVTCCKYIERNARYKYTANHKLVDVIPQQPRVTRSSKNDSNSTHIVSEMDSEPIQHEFETVQNEAASVDEFEIVQNEAASVENEIEIVECEFEPVQDNSLSTSTPAAPTENVFTGAPIIDSLFTGYSFTENINAQLNQQTSADVMYDDTRPICADLVTCTDTITVILPNLTPPEFVGAYATSLKDAGIYTVADLAQMTELKVYELPLKVERVKKVLKEHSDRIQGITPTKPTRKMKPMTLVSVLEIDDDTRTESVIMPLGYKDMNGPVSNEPAVPTVDGTEESASDSELCNIKTEMYIDVDLTIEENLPSTSSSARLTESPNKGQQQSCPRYVAPTKHNSHASPKENILDVKIHGVPVQEIATSLMHLMNDRKHDPKPLIQLLFGGVSNLTNTVASMGLFKLHHHLACGRNWEGVINDVITHIGILQLVQYLCKMQSVPVTVIVESVLKHSLDEISYDFLCDLLNPTELLQYVTRVHTLTDIIEQYDTTSVYQSLSELCEDKTSNVPQFRDVIRELYSVIIDNPSDASSQINNLSVVEIGKIVIDRFGESSDMDLFIETIYKKLPLDRYLKPVPKMLLTSAAPLPSNTTETVDDVTSRFVLQIKEGTLDERTLKQLFQAICAKMNWMQLSECYYEEMKKKFT